MEEVANQPKSNEMGNIFKFYFIILAMLLGFMIGEKLFEDLVLKHPVSFFDHMILSSILYVIFLIFTQLYARHTSTSNYEMGWHGSYLLKSLIIGFLATSGYLIAAFGYQMPLNYTSWIPVIELLLFTLLIGITEESMFRGYIQANFLKGASQMRAVILTGILFSLLHIPSYIISGNYMNLFGLLTIFFIGMILGFTRIYTGNIWGVMLAHATWDFYMFLFTPETITDWTTLIPALVASLAMWGTILSSMFIAKLWIDRPTQMPGELAREYSHKIGGLIQRSERIQKKISGLQKSSVPNQRTIDFYSNEIKLNDDSIEIIKQHLPQFNASNYKLLRKLIPLKRDKLRYENLLLKFNLNPARKANVQLGLTDTEAKITAIEKELSLIKSQEAKDKISENR